MFVTIVVVLFVGVVCCVPGVRYDATQDVGGSIVWTDTTCGSHCGRVYIAYRVPPAAVATGMSNHNEIS